METGTKVAIAAAAGVAVALIAAGIAEHYAHARTPTNALQAAAQALMAVNPCLKSSEPQVREFQKQAIAANYLTGLTSDDGRYGSETQTALAEVVGTSAPPACSPRPGWWGSPSTSTNP